MTVLRDIVVNAGLMSAAEAEAFIAMTADPADWYSPFFMTSVWARRPL